MKPLQFFIGLMKLFFISLCAALVLGLNPVIPFVALIVLSCIIPLPKNAFYGVVLEAWANYIIERFWKDNAFLKNSFDDSQYVLQGRIVHIPQPGAKPNVIKNRSSFPGTAVRRTDTDVTYTLDEYSTDPTHIPNIDAINLSYNKQDSVLGDHMQVISETVADDMILKWAANATTVKTTGGSAAGTVAGVGAQTGTRYGFDHSDLKKLMIKMNANNVPKQDRFVMIDDNMFEFFYDSLSETNARDFSRYADVANGVIGKLHGFSIGTRSAVLATASDDTLKALGSSLAATDNLGSIAWYKNSVASAIGDKKLFEQIDSPLYYGDIHSILMMAGGRVRRSDSLGVYIIEQGATS